MQPVLLRRDFDDRFHLRQDLVRQVTFHLMPICEMAHRWDFLFAQATGDVGFPTTPGLERAA